LKKTDLTYSKYLNIDQIISLQKPLSDPLAHDEMLFIIIHQVYELWFKQILFETEAMIGNLSKKDLLRCSRSLTRIAEIFRVLIQQIDVLETMTPVEFNQFRSHLNPASGFQSFQFRELELLMGADPKDYEKFFEMEPEWASRIKNRTSKASVKTALTGFLQSNGLLKPEGDLTQAIFEIYENPKHLEIQNLCEHLIKVDELISLWRFRHVQMVERMIGMKRGTGGSLGVSYLQSTLRKRFFNELWDARTKMGGEY
jgi:tryptophan 2,3-dioxygenase